MASAPFKSERVRSGFVADTLGLGHVVVSARSQDETRAFYCDVLGFRLSDRIVAEIYGYHADMLFLHTNPRHHSIAFGERQDKNIHHFMLEVRSMDDVGLAFDRALQGGVHGSCTRSEGTPNDRMFSFYARTPSGFQFEVGWGRRRSTTRRARRPRSDRRVGTPSAERPRAAERRTVSEAMSRRHEAPNPPAPHSPDFRGESRDGVRAVCKDPPAPPFPRKSGERGLGGLGASWQRRRLDDREGGTRRKVRRHRQRVACPLPGGGRGPAVLFLGSGPGASGYSSFRRNYPSSPPRASG